MIYTYAKRWLKNSDVGALKQDLVDAGFMRVDNETGELVRHDCSLVIFPVNYDPAPEYDEDGNLLQAGTDHGPHANLKCRAEDQRLANLPAENETMPNGTTVLSEPSTPWCVWAE